MKKVWLVITAIALLCSLQFGTTAYACDCNVPASAKEGLEEADAVFTGKIQALKKVILEGTIYNKYLVETTRVWKGVQESSLVIYTPITSCEMSFIIGEEYLIYAERQTDSWHVSNCGRTSELANRLKDLADLGAGEEPSVQIDSDISEFYVGGSKIVTWLFTGAIAVIVGAIAFVIFRYRKSTD